MRLFVKGTEIATLVDEAERRGIWLFPDEAWVEGTTIIAEASDSDAEKIGEWYNERPNTIPGYGFPDGTLLHFSYGKD